MKLTENWQETPESSQIMGFGYTVSTRVLTVQFKGGAVYDYEGVLESDYREMAEAPSCGSYFHRFIRSARFQYSKRA